MTMQLEVSDGAHRFDFETHRSADAPAGPVLVSLMAWNHIVILVVGAMEGLWLGALHSRGVVKWEPLWVVFISWLSYVADFAVPKAPWIKVQLANGEYLDWTRACGWMCTCPVRSHL